MLKIIKADNRHLSDLEEMTKAYHAENWLGEIMTYSETAANAAIKEFIVAQHIDVLILADDDKAVGLCAAMLVPIWGSDNQVRCTVVYSYIKPEYRGKGHFQKMIAKHETWAKGHKALCINLGDGAQYGPKFSGVSKRMGYTRIGTDCYKEL